ISKSLGRSPEQAVQILRSTMKGAELLISYWTGLAAAHEANGDWDPAQRSLAYDLLGVRKELRSGSPILPPPGDKERLAAVAKRQIEILRARIKDFLSNEHQANRGMAVAGMAMHEDAVTRKLRRKESLARTDYNRARNTLLHSRAEAEA